MNLPQIENSENYIGLYVVDFGEYSSTGFTAQEVAELLESEKFAHCKVYKIHNAYPDGRLELKGVTPETFQLEMGMFFYQADGTTAKDDFKNLVNVAVQNAPPCRAKIHLAKYSDDKLVTAVIYPAEYNDEISSWLTAVDFKTAGPAEGGIEAVQRYYNEKPEIIDQHQLFAKDELKNRTGEELLANLKVAIQR
ncbi:MAG: hypothetical protein FVQ80_06365 [Planctomycetes bacterium]|nr:hypothetical protein [Planctomycetota bacterium]